MAEHRIKSLERVKELFQELPGIGPRSAERVAFHLLRSPREYAASLAEAMLELKDKVRHCSECFNLTEADPCGICRDPGRDQGEIWVVEQPKDLLALEATGLIHGVYHVLMGHISPLEGVEPGDLTIESLLERVRSREVHEVVVATNPTVEGDGTALHLESLLRDLKVKTTRPARGLAVGSALEYATPGMLEAAIRGRSTA